MKKISLLLVITIFSIVSNAQKTTTKPKTPTPGVITEEQKTLLLGMVGGVTAAYLINTQEVINNLMLLQENKLYTTDQITPKLTSHKNIINVLRGQADKVVEAKILDPQTDQLYVSGYVDILNSLAEELDLFLAYLKSEDADKKTAFETSRTDVQKQIRTFLQMD